MTQGIKHRKECLRVTSAYSKIEFLSGPNGPVKLVIASKIMLSTLQEGRHIFELFKNVRLFPICKTFHSIDYISHIQEVKTLRRDLVVAHMRVQEEQMLE